MFEALDFELLKSNEPVVGEFPAEPPQIREMHHGRVFVSAKDSETLQVLVEGDTHAVFLVRFTPLARMIHFNGTSGNGLWEFPIRMEPELRRILKQWVD